MPAVWYRSAAGIGSDAFASSSERGRRTTGLAPMPKNPTLIDYFNLRFAPANHVLQSATRALKEGMPERTILACLLHPFAGPPTSAIVASLLYLFDRFEQR